MVWWEVGSGRPSICGHLLPSVTATFTPPSNYIYFLCVGLNSEVFPNLWFTCISRTQLFSFRHSTIPPLLFSLHQHCCCDTFYLYLLPLPNQYCHCVCCWWVWVQLSVTQRTRAIIQHQWLLLWQVCVCYSSGERDIVRKESLFWRRYPGPKERGMREGRAKLTLRN